MRLQAPGCSPPSCGSCVPLPCSLPDQAALSPLLSLPGVGVGGVEETYWLVGKAGFPRPCPTPLDIKLG